MPPLQVLIADDSKAVRNALFFFLEHKPDIHVCAEAKNGREAVDLALAFKPDLVILDVVMPGMNGIEVSMILKQALPEAKAILFTMYGDLVGKKLAAAAGVNIVLEKADGLTKLIHVIDCFLRASNGLSQASS
jgi:two-component system, NarL family, response regulator LiaR